ncbi:reverse transcriptase [Senna tora]|uniref:Reverse transcriptase n=1 Tax=Senna tora TaxID=362788 RepID=A0A835CHB2_9FABA|nr:reverse transcriptase [Senna tora]
MLVASWTDYCCLMISGYVEDEVELDWNGQEIREVGEHMLIEKILAEKVLNKNAVKTMIRKGWNIRDGVNIGEIHGLPLEGLNRRNGKRLGRKVGEVFAIEDPLAERRICRSFLRVGVELDTRKPLVTGLWIIGPRGDKIWISFKYERLQNYCYGCGVLGHEVKGCDRERFEGGEEMEVNVYGPGLGVPSVREMRNAILVLKSEYEEWYGEKGMEEKKEKFHRNRDDVMEERFEEEGSEKKGSVLLEDEDMALVDQSQRWKEGRGLNKDIKMSSVWEGIKKAVQRESGKEINVLGDEGSGFRRKWRGTNMSKQSEVGWDFQDKSKGGICTDIVVRDADYIVELPHEEGEGGDNQMVSKLVEDNKLAEDLRRVVIKRKEEERMCNAEIKKIKREIYVIEKENFDKGKEDEIEVVRKKGKKRMAKVVVERMQLFDVLISEGYWERNVGEDGGFVFQAEASGSGIAEVKELKKICKKFKPSVVFLMETRMKEKKMEKVRRKCCELENSFYVDAVGKSGGLAVWWSGDVTFSHINGSKNIIHGLMNAKHLEGPCYVSFVYGAPIKKEKVGVWNRLRRLKPLDDMAWFSLGDFNDILSNAEKFGGCIRSSGSLLEFQNLVHDCDWVDLGFKGPKFTWSNKQLGGDLIKERLDRCFCNLVAREQYQNAMVIHLEAISSDHNPLIIDLKPMVKKGRRPFKFENMWMEHEDYAEVVGEGWDWEEGKDDVIDQMTILSKRLDHCGRFLSDWGKKAFPNNRKEIEKLTNEISVCRSGIMTSEVKGKIEDLVKRIECLWDREEEYWQQRARLNWLQAGDRNTRDMDYVLSFVNKKVSVEDNESLMREVSVDEVKRAAFDLGALKAPGPDDVLSSMLVKAVEEGKVAGVKLARSCPSLTHCFFADDSLLFMNASKGDCGVVKEILRCYCEASGQDMNLDKSNIFFSKNTPDCIREDICADLGIVASSNPGKYLGLPTLWERSKVVALSFVREKMMRKIQSWKKNVLSQAGREILIKAVASSVPAFPMVVFKFPKVFCKDLDAAVARFWWDKKEGGGGIHWQAWNKITRSKKEGGLGFRDFEAFNVALLAKLAWRLLMCLNELWVKVIKGIYFPNSSFLEARKGARASWGWSSLIVGRDALKLDLGWRVGDGEQIRIFGDRWLPSLEDSKLSSSSPNPDWDDRRVSSIIQEGRWKLDDVEDFLSRDEVNAILGMPIPFDRLDDGRVWLPSRKGVFDVKLGYHVIKGRMVIVDASKPYSSFSVPKELWGAIWKLKVPGKVRHFIWRVCSNSLPVMSNLVRRRCGVNALCPVCNMEEESSEHMLLFCKWTEMVWFGSMLCARWNRFDVRRVEDWWCNLLLGESKVEDWSASLFAFTCWFVWKARCRMVFEHVPVDSLFVIQKSFSAAAEFWNANGWCSGGSGLRLGAVMEDRWSPPIGNALKINCDAAFSCESGIAGLGIVIRNEYGVVVDGKGVRTNACSAPVAESLALREALRLALDLQLVNFSVESDCNDLVKAINLKDVNWDWRCSNIVKDILLLCGRLNWPSIMHVKRSANKAADWLASVVSRRMCPLDWDVNPPSSLAEILLFDCCRFKTGIG